jgi:hypothetical protein
MANAGKTSKDHVHELNRRIQENPGKKMRIIKEFYSEMVKANERETADLVLLIRSMMDGDPKVPAWFQKAGFVTGALTLFFLMALVVASVLGREVPDGSKFLVTAVFALGCALSATFLGGDAVASGKIPFLADKSPLAISATGGIAVLVIVLVLGYYFYVK